MDTTTILIIAFAAGIVVVLLGLGLWWKYRTPPAAYDERQLLSYETADNFSNLGHEVSFANSKNTKVWIGAPKFMGMHKIIQKKRDSQLKKQYEAYGVSLRIAKNYCRTCDDGRELADDLACVNARAHCKYFHPIRADRMLGIQDKSYAAQQQQQPQKQKHKSKSKKKARRALLTHYQQKQCPPFNKQLLSGDTVSVSLGVCRALNTEDPEQYRAFQLMMQTLEHPFLMHTYEVDTTRDRKHVFVYRDLEEQGSIRDHIYQSNLSRPYAEKYSRPGKPFPSQFIRRYGRQILEGLSYLNQCGFVHYYLHTGNVIIQAGAAKLTEFENCFFGFQVKHPLHKHLLSVKKLFPELDVQLCLFGYVLFEMATGMESPTASPVDCFHEIPRKISAPVKRLLGRIFGDKSQGGPPLLDDLRSDPYFRAMNVPDGNPSAFVALREENAMVDRIRNGCVLQCYYTYSRAAILGEKGLAGNDNNNNNNNNSNSNSNTNSRKKKKKKKKKSKKKSKSKSKKRKKKKLLTLARNDQEFVDEDDSSVNSDDTSDFSDRKSFAEEEEDGEGDDEDDEDAYLFIDAEDAEDAHEMNDGLHSKSSTVLIKNESKHKKKKKKRKKKTQSEIAENEEENGAGAEVEEFDADADIENSIANMQISDESAEDEDDEYAFAGRMKSKKESSGEPLWSEMPVANDDDDEYNDGLESSLSQSNSD